MASAIQGSTTTPDNQATPTEAAWALSTRVRIRTSRPRFWRLAESRKRGARIVAPGSCPSIYSDLFVLLRHSAASPTAFHLRSGGTSGESHFHTPARTRLIWRSHVPLASPAAARPAHLYCPARSGGRPPLQPGFPAQRGQSGSQP